MANFFSGLWEAAKNPLDDAKLIGKTLIGKESLKDFMGDHQRQMNKVTVPILGNNKLSKNSDAVAGAIVGGIFAAPLLAGGASAAGGSTAGAAGGATAGTVGTSTASGFGGVGGMGVTGSTTGFGGVGGMAGTTASSGTAASGLGGVGGMSSGAGSMGSLSTYFTPSTQFGTTAMSSGSQSVTPATTTSTDWTRLANSMKNLQSQTSNKNQAPQVQMSSPGGRGMSFDSNRFKNAALEREYQSIYSSPTYRKLV